MILVKYLDYQLHYLAQYVWHTEKKILVFFRLVWTHLPRAVYR